MKLWYRIRCAWWLWWDMPGLPSPRWCWNYSQCFEPVEGSTPREDVEVEMSYMEP